MPGWVYMQKQCKMFKWTLIWKSLISEIKFFYFLKFVIQCHTFIASSLCSEQKFQRICSKCLFGNRLTETSGILAVATHTYLPYHQSRYLIARPHTQLATSQLWSTEHSEGKELCILCGKNWIIKYHLDKLRLQRLKHIANLTTSSRVVLEKLIDAQLVNAGTLLWNSPKFHYHNHTIPHSVRPVPTLTQINPVHPISLKPILIFSSHFRVGLTSSLFMLFTSPMHATCPPHVIHLDLISLIISEEHKL